MAVFQLSLIPHMQVRIYQRLIGLYRAWARMSSCQKPEDLLGKWSTNWGIINMSLESNGRPKLSSRDDVNIYIRNIWVMMMWGCLAIDVSIPTFLQNQGIYLPNKCHHTIKYCNPKVDCRSWKVKAICETERFGNLKARRNAGLQ
jgi:hypothetical protein